MSDVLEKNLKDDLKLWQDEGQEKTLIRFTHFNKNKYELEIIDSVKDAKISDDEINWIYITGLNDKHKIIELIETFDIHPLVIEDMLSVDERTKVESYKDYVFMIMDTVKYQRNKHKVNRLDFSQMSFILKDNVLITVDEIRSHQFNSIQQRLKYIKEARFHTVEGLFLGLIDQVIDNYYKLFEIIGNDINEIEEEIITEANKELLSDLYTIKRNLIYLRKTLWPLRNVISDLSKTNFYVIDESTSLFYRDLYDHTIQMIEFIEVYRDMTDSLISTIDTEIANKSNDVMKILTVWSTIFLPITFITGVYGMNFQYMPELYQKWAYPLFWILIVLIVVLMVKFFKKKDWI